MGKNYKNYMLNDTTIIEQMSSTQDKKPTPPSSVSDLTPTRTELSIMIKEVESLLDYQEILHCIFETFGVVLGLGSCHLKKHCFNEGLVNDMSNMLRTNGISFAIPMEEDAIMRATCCSHLNGCPECRAVCCLKDLLALPEGENALLNVRLCEEVCRCVRGGAGIMSLSLISALLRTSPYFGEGSLILLALTNSVKEDTWKAAAEIANIFFDTARTLNLEFLFFEPRVSAELREQRYEELENNELQLCQTVYATEIAQIQKQKDVAEVIEEVMRAALLEAGNNKLPKCHICNGNPMEYPPIFVPKTCGHPICCLSCVNADDLDETLKHKCPICDMGFTDDDGDFWWPFRNPNDHRSDPDTN